MYSEVWNMAFFPINQEEFPNPDISADRCYPIPDIYVG
jgi:hypothetical protein